MNTLRFHHSLKIIELVYNLESNSSMIEKIPPEGESFSDFIATFTKSVGCDTYFDLQYQDR